MCWGNVVPQNQACNLALREPEQSSKATEPCKTVPRLKNGT